MMAKVALNHVVIGNGIVSKRLARLLANDKKKVIVLSRSTSIESKEGIEYRKADASSLQSLLSTVPTAGVVYNCANPPYDKWMELWPPISKAINEYAMSCEADLVTCSNLYGYGPYDGALTEDLPLNATWKNGRVRADMWNEALSLYKEGKLRATEVRGSDYICASDQSRMGDRVVPTLMRGKKVQLLGALDTPHSWTDPDDVALLMMTLAQDERSWGRPWHVPSNEPRSQRQVVADIAQELEVSSYHITSVGPAIEKVLGIINPVIRELSVANYQFNRPFIMNSSAAIQTFGLDPKPWSLVITDLVSAYRTSYE